MYGARILRHLSAGAATFSTGGLSDADRMSLAAVTRSSDIHRVNLLDREGRVF